MRKIWTEQDIILGRRVFTASRSWTIGCIESESSHDGPDYCIISEKGVVLQRSTRADLARYFNRAEFRETPLRRNRPNLRIVRVQT